MGLSDRDYMRERDRARFDRERPFAPPSSSIGFPWIVLFWLVAGFILFKLYSNYLPAKQPAAIQSDRLQNQEVEAPPAPRRQARAAPTIPDRPRQPAPTETRDTTASSNTIYLCRAYSGGTFWAQAHCNQHNALIERIAYVPPNLPFDQQVAIAAEQRRSSAAVIQSTTTVTQSTDTSAASKQSECKALDARVVHLDALARQPQSGQMQDWISGQRKDARDRQFRLRC